MCHMEVADSDRGLAVRFKALRLDALRFVILFVLDFGALAALLVVCVIGPNI